MFQVLRAYGHIASQCPNKNTMLLLENGETASDNEEEILEESEQEEEEEFTPAVEGQLMVVEKLLNTQMA